MISNLRSKMQPTHDFRICKIQTHIRYWYHSPCATIVCIRRYFRTSGGDPLTAIESVQIKSK